MTTSQITHYIKLYPIEVRLDGCARTKACTALADTTHGHGLVGFTPYRLMDEVHRQIRGQLIEKAEAGKGDKATVHLRMSDAQFLGMEKNGEIQVRKDVLLPGREPRGTLLGILKTAHYSEKGVNFCGMAVLTGRDMLS